MTSHYTLPRWGRAVLDPYKDETDPRADRLPHEGEQKAGRGGNR